MSLVGNLVRCFKKPHGSGDGEGGKTTIINFGSSSNYDNTNLNVVNVNANNGSINYLTSKNITFDNMKGDFMDVRAGVVSEISGNTMGYKNGTIEDLHSDEQKTNTLKVSDTANINNLINKYMQSNNIVTDNLTVNKSAHFFELIIDKINSVKGTILNTAANCNVDYVEAYDANDDKTTVTNPAVEYFRLYWKTTDSDNKAINNEWKVDDQAICQSFNVQEGVSHNTNNKYYWRLVTATDSDNIFNLGKRYVNLNTDYVFNDKVSDVPNEYYDIDFTNGFIYSDGTNDIILDSESYEGSDYNNGVLTVEAVGDAIIVKSPVVTQADIDDPDNPIPAEYLGQPKYILSNGYLTFHTGGSYTKLSIITVYDDGTVEYKNWDNYKESYTLNTTTDKNVSYFIVRTDVFEVWDECNWIDISARYQDPNETNGIPERGDVVCQLGYRYGSGASADDIARASAIIIAAYKTPDASVKPPSYAQYEKITDFNLGSHRMTYFDATGGHIVGEFTVNTGNTLVPLDQYIQNQTTPQETEILIEDGNAEVDFCIFQTNNANQITDLNNFPGQTDALGRRDLFIKVYSQHSVLPIEISCDLFGRTVVLGRLNQSTSQFVTLPDGPDTANGIYIYSVTVINSTTLRVTFDYRGNNPQTIINGSSVKFYGQIQISGTTYYPSKSINIACVSSVQGTDAEVWKLFKDTETAEVLSTNDDNNGKLNYLLRYGLIHIIGTSASFDQPETGMYITVDSYNSSGTLLDSYIDLDQFTYPGGKSGAGYWEFGSGSPVRWWSKQEADRESYFVVQIFNANDECLDSTIVNVNIQTTGLFVVQNGLTQSIQNEVNTRGQQYTELTQTTNQISTTVQNQQSSINNITGDMASMQTDISIIDQKADRIDLSVTQVNTDLDTLETNIERTGIDIEQGKITLSAENTVIDGNLSIHNANEGLVIYDNSTNTPKIAVQGNQIGTYTDFIANGNIVSDQYDARTTINGNTVTFTQISIGDLNAGNKLSVNASMTDMTSTTVTAISYTYNLLRNGNVESTTSGSATRSGGWYNFYIPEFTISNAGSYSVQVTLTVTGAAAGDEFMILLGVSRTLSVLQKIGTDGAFFGTSWQRLSWFGSDRQRLQYDNNYIELNNNGVMYHPIGATLATEIGSTTTVVRRTSGTSYNAGANEGLIVIANGVSEYSGWYTIYLQSPTMLPGKVYYIKNYSNRDVRVGVGSGSDEKYMLDDDGTGVENFRDIGHNSYMIISDGVYWIMWYCA